MFIWSLYLLTSDSVDCWREEHAKSELICQEMQKMRSLIEEINRGNW